MKAYYSCNTIAVPAAATATAPTLALCHLVSFYLMLMSIQHSFVSSSSYSLLTNVSWSKKYFNQHTYVS